MSERNTLGQRDAIDSGWFTAEHIGSIRSSASYRRGGWWFLPAWLPDKQANDVGPFKTKVAALAEAEGLAALHRRKP